jgi:RNA polymerase sigma-70 factor (ECF subfamily)
VVFLRGWHLHLQAAPVNDRDEFVREQLARHREYLRLVARLQVDARWRSKVDPSDVVQETITRAWEKIDQFQGSTAAEFGGWLRQILASQLATEARKWTRPGRAVAREQVLAGIDRSSHQLEELLGNNSSSPASRAEREEALLRLADAFGALPADERTAIELKYFDDLTVVKIAELMERSPGRVSRLIGNGLTLLRTQLGDHWGNADDDNAPRPG